METQETIKWHGETFVITRGDNGKMLTMISEGMFSLVIFYRSGSDYAYVIQDDDSGEVLHWFHGAYYAQFDLAPLPLNLVVLHALEALGEEEDEAACDEAEYVDGWDNTDYDDAPEDFMRADSDLQYEW